MVTQDGVEDPNPDAYMEHGGVADGGLRSQSSSSIILIFCPPQMGIHPERLLTAAVVLVVVKVAIDGVGLLASMANPAVRSPLPLTHVAVAASSTVSAPADSATPSVGHQPRPVLPGAPPTQLSKEHPNAVNYAISAGGVVLGVALITTFALICRWRKRRRQRTLEDQIDQRIREKSLSRLEANRNESLVKLPNISVLNVSATSVAKPLPRIPTTLSVNLSTESLPRSRQPCLRMANQHASCGCSDCSTVVASVALVPSRSTQSTTSSHSTVRHTSTATSRARHSTPIASVRSYYSSRSPTPTLGNVSSGQRSHRRNDENVHRVASTRTPPMHDASPRALAWTSDEFDEVNFSAPTYTPSYPRGVGVGIVVATSTGSLGSPATPSLGFSTPRLGSSIAGSPALSDDAGATIRSPGAYSPSPLEYTYTPDGPHPSSLDLASSRECLDHGIAHMQVSPLIQDGPGDVPSQQVISPVSPPTKQHGHNPSLSSAEPAKDTNNIVPNTCDAQAPPSLSHHDDSGQRWFTDVDWYGTDGPLAGLEQPVAHHAGSSASERV